MHDHPSLWICLADGAYARILEPDESGRGYSVVTEFQSATAHLRSRALGTDRPGRAQESANAAHHALEPRSNPHLDGKRKFVRLVADYLNREGALGAFDELMLVAPATCLRELRDGLDAANLLKLKASKAKDLAKVPLGKLSRHLAALQRT